MTNNILLEGMTGEPLPYLLRSDGMVAGILFLCIILVSVVFSKGKKHIMQQLKSFTTNRERASLFDETNTSDFRYTLVLILHTCILLGFCIYNYLSEVSPSLFSQVSHSLLLGGFVGCAIVYMIAKWSIYRFINWVFFTKAKNVSWIESYFNIMVWLGILLLPIVLLTVYFDLSVQNEVYLMGSALIFAKILLFCKCFSNFFNKFQGAFHLILYFCALEILPDLIAWKGIVLASNNLI